MRTTKTYITERRRWWKIESMKRRLQRKSYPRLHVSIILLLTGLAGFLVSFALLRLGVSAMWLRYPVAIIVAYGVFLLLLRVWLSLCRPRDWDVFDLADTTIEIISETQGGDSGFGGAGDFAGGGAGGSWGEGVSTITSTNTTVSTITSTKSSGSSGFSFDLDLDDGWVIIPVVLALLAGVIAALYVVYIAPALLAEILLDGVLMAGLYKRVKSIEHKHWLRCALRRTAVPAIVVIVFFTIAGYAMHTAAPGARSIGEVWQHITER